MILLFCSRKLKKKCQKELAKFNISEKDITHVCIAPNLFPLLQYLLLLDDDVVFHHTYFFLSEIIPNAISKQLPSTCFQHFKSSWKKEIIKRIHKLTLRLFKYHSFPFLRECELFAYDLPYTSLCIGNRNYSLLADAQNWLTLNMQENSAEYQRQQENKSKLLTKAQELIFGNVFVNYFGNNKQCTDIYLTEKNQSPVLDGKNIHIDSLDELWEHSSIRKKEFIKSLFGITSEDILLLNSRSILFFTQPIISDCSLTTEEYTELMKFIKREYGEDNLIIKTHPRDKFDYQKFFPKAVVFEKKINSQLLYLVGVRPQKIVTFFSTAIEAFPEDIECDYYGTSIHDKVKQCFGTDYTAKRAVNHCHLANS